MKPVTLSAVIAWLDKRLRSTGESLELDYDGNSILVNGCDNITGDGDDLESALLDAYRRAEARGEL